MASPITAYEYDVFISYRQKDNKYDGWVTEFVDNLKKELDATFKDEVKVYFDENPKDGLLDTHVVEDSLNNKIRCGVFIPIISKTYCDVKSYAWNNEFKFFLKQAAGDPLGLKVKLSSGNVASRVIPVRIHDIDTGDKVTLEKILGPLRSVDFIFKAPGVNRPLRAREERPFDNHYPVFYRDQINKLANAIREIISGIRNPAMQLEEEEFQSKTSGNHRHPKSIAVLPFVNMSSEADQEYFSDGVSEEIINMLVQVNGLYVAGRTSSFSFKNKNEDLRVIAEKLGVDYILEGSVRKSGKMIRITAQLIEAASGFHHWSEKYDRELRDVFAVQDEIASTIVNKLRVTLENKISGQAGRVQTNNVEAYEYYLKGRAYFYKRGLDMFEAQRCFEAALNIDKQYALAWAGLADTHSMLCFHSYTSPEQTWPKAIEAAQQAIQYGPELSESHAALGTLALLYERNWDKAEQQYVRALELNPNFLQARSWYALFYLQGIRGLNEQALAHAKIAVENDPLSAYAWTILSLVKSRAGIEYGIAEANKAVEFDPDAFLSWYILGNCYHWSGQYEKAIPAFTRSLDNSGRHAWALIALLVTYVDAGKPKEAAVIYNELRLREQTGNVLPSIMAIGSASLGKKEEALEFAYKAYERHDPFQIQSSRLWPANKYLMAIPEYQQVIENLRLN